jgi:hypothetical protein
MDAQTFFNIAVGIAGFFGAWILNNISKSIEKIDQEVRAMPHTYVTQNSYARDIDEIKSMLRLIFDKLDNKADK